MEHLRNIADRGDRKFSDRNLFQGNTDRDKSQIDWPGIDPETSTVTAWGLSAWARPNKDQH